MGLTISCQSCGQPMPVSVTFCPMCGAEAKSVDFSDTLKEGDGKLEESDKLVDNEPTETSTAPTFSAPRSTAQGIAVADATPAPVIHPNTPAPLAGLVSAQTPAAPLERMIGDATPAPLGNTGAQPVQIDSPPAIGAQPMPAAQPSQPALGDQTGPRKTAELHLESAQQLSAMQFVQPRVPHIPGPRPPAAPVGVHRVPGTPARIPITPRPIQIVIAFILIGFGIWALAAFLPGKRPWTDSEADAIATTMSESEFDRLEAARLDAGPYVSGNVGAIALIVFGIGLAITGALYRAQTETICRKCNRQVIGWKSAFGLQCPLGDHHAKLNWFVLIATIVFWVTAIGMVGGIAILALV